MPGDPQCITGPITHALKAEGFDASEDGTGRGQPIVTTGPLLSNGKAAGSATQQDAEQNMLLAVSVALRGRDGGGARELGDDKAHALRASQGGGDKPHVLAFDTTQVSSPANYSNPKPGDPCHPLAAGAHAPAVTFPINTQLGLRGAETSNTSREGIGVGDAGDPAFTLQSAHSHAVATAMQVRRLTPRECERLQGFPDDYTNIPWKNKPAEVCPDGPRYKALGNSMAVPCMRWIGRRIMRALEGK